MPFIPFFRPKLGYAHTPFPQPIFPWRLNPGRLPIDLSQWNELDAGWEL